jgi:hypothetical protein
MFNFKENPLHAWLLALVSVFLILFLGVQSLKGIAEYREVGHEPSGRDTITIDGEGKVSGQPDLAQVDIGLFTEGADVPSAQEQNSEKVNAIVRALQELGIAREDIQTNNYSIMPRYQYDEGRQTVIGYAVSQNVSVKVRDLSSVGTVLSRVGQLGANQVNGVQFTIDDPSSLKQEARKLALEDAEMKAEELAEALGLKITRVVGFSESSGSIPPPMPFASREFDGLGAGGDMAIPEIEPGSLDVTSFVSVTFEIR